MAAIDSVKKGFIKMFGSRNERIVKLYMKRVEKIGELEPQVLPLSDEDIRQRVAQMREQLRDGEVTVDELRNEALALIREAMDRHVGIRNIFSPEHADAFDASKLSGEAKAAYDKVKAEIEALEPQPVLGADGPVPSWLLVPIPTVIYDAVRQMYPESRPPFRCRPFDVQLIGATVLFEGKIAEMRTGEGKTIVAPMACFLAALEGHQCHVVTVSDYHVQRDRDWTFPAFHHLGMSVGAIHPMHMQHPQIKQQMYQCDVVYGTNSEFGFDFLRDNMKLSVQEQVQRKRNFCIVDEIDSILIDEARTPLIISGPAHDDAPKYPEANKAAIRLAQLQKQANADTAARIKQDGFVDQQAKVWRTTPGAIQKIVDKFRDLGPNFLEEKEAEQIDHVQYYVAKPEQRQASMTPLGIEEAQNMLGTKFYVGDDMSMDHLVSQAVRAHAVYERDKDYVVQNGEVVIVDEFTGRLMVGRQWSDGLHQAVEAKEGVKIKQETQTLATITIQNFFKLYKRLAGMTGTAATEATEFMEIYGLDVVQIPTNRLVIRDDANDLIYLTEDAKWNAIVDEIKTVSEMGRPVLVGTTSVEKSEMLSAKLKKRTSVEHEVLNAKQHEREAHIVVEAGRQREDKRGNKVGVVTISTNMAGRGTDIRLGPGVHDLGGLHIIGTERHESRRIDNQLRGRAGRQGDPGSSRFFISMEDDLMKMFAGKSTMKALSMLGMKEDDAIEHKWITKSVENAQKKVEERNFQIRKNLLEYDEVMEYQRNTFYGTRQRVLEGRGVKELITDYIAESVEDAVGKYLDRDFVPEQIAAAARSELGAVIETGKLRADSLDEVENRLRDYAKTAVRSEIDNSIGEYLPEDRTEEAWDLKGLTHWARTRFDVDLKGSQTRNASPTEIAAIIAEGAFARIDERSLEGFGRFFEPNYAAGELANWAKTKFGLEIDAEQLAPKRTESISAAQQRVVEYLYERVVAEYDRREINYPVEFVIGVRDSAAQTGSTQGEAWANQQIAQWADDRFDLGWTPESLISRSRTSIERDLMQANKAWHGEQLDAWVDEAVGLEDEALVERFKERWNAKCDTDALAEAEDRREFIRERCLNVLRTELAQLERHVLLRNLDQSWKDHLFAMDQVRDSVSLRGYSEKDPKLEFKREGSYQFQEMLRSVRERVSEQVFRARLTLDAQLHSVFGQQQAQHDVAASMGVSAAGGGGGGVAGSAEQQRDLEAAERAGSEGQVTQTIVRTEEKVGRNDPCPCGSGKKYKQCHGRK